jgi:hypothetical protein
MARSERHPTWYRVGRLPRGDVYWQPGGGYAEEGEYAALVGAGSLTEVEWFAHEGDLEKIVSDMHANPGLRNAMDGMLYGHILDAVEDAAYAERCEHEKRETLRWGAGI